MCDANFPSVRRSRRNMVAMRRGQLVHTGQQVEVVLVPVYVFESGINILPEIEIACSFGQFAALRRFNGKALVCLTDACGVAEGGEDFGVEREQVGRAAG